MNIIGEVLLPNLLAYVMNLASSERSGAIAIAREKAFKKAVENEDGLRKAFASTYSIRDEVRGACAELARNRAQLGVTPKEEPLWRLLSDEVFQADLAEWLMAGGIEEGKDVQARILQAMETILARVGASPQQIAFLKTDYFDSLEKTLFAHPVLAHWRHQQSLDYLREQVVVLRRRAEEAAGIYSQEKQKAALGHYCENALAVWDIIDLSNLPEGDIHMATQKLLLRQLYMPLRIEVEATKGGEGSDAAVARFEEQRDVRRHREAGHLVADNPERPEPKDSRSPVGERLGVSRRLVVLGDPGGGKTTMLRWMATAYLLLHKDDAAFTQVPDTQTLPRRPWIPVLIRCRDLGEADLCRCFTDFLTQHLKKSELLPEEADVMRAVILDRIATGKALLLVDGLDEIANPQVRTLFCQELERTAARFPEVPIVVTSRIVGYRDMPYRMGSGFEHGVIAELSREDKDLFARRWVELTEQHQLAPEKAKRAQELLDALHSSDRIERLTGNPMLLTTLALVKRKVGKLPNRRNKLYAEAVSVLLNWNPSLYKTIEEDEAIPQLEYLAYEMCRRGVQRLTDDEVLDLLEKLRIEYPNIRPIRRREPQAFLALLEARSSILIKSGSIWQKNEGKENSVWEFRHLTFQEYLAARAILDGRYPGRDRTKSFAEQVAPLAGTVESFVQSRRRPGAREEMDVPESWREALRLLVADCKDDDVDAALLAVLCPMAGEDAAKTARPRAVLAALCLSDEPNISEESGRRVLTAFASIVSQGDGVGHASTTVDKAAIEIGASIWAPLLKTCLIDEYCRRPPGARENLGGLWGMVEVSGWARSSLKPSECFEGLVRRLQSADRVEALSAALAVMEAAFEGKAFLAPGLIDLLFIMLGKKKSYTHAAAWALVWLSGGWIERTRAVIWVPSAIELAVLARMLPQVSSREKDLVPCLIHILGKAPGNGTLQAILSKLNDRNANVRRAVFEAIGNLGDKQAVPPLLAKLDGRDAKTRIAVIRVLVKLADERAVPPLLAKLDDPDVNVRSAVIGALVKLGDRRAVPLLLNKLDDSDTNIAAPIAAALHILGEPRGVAALGRFLSSQDAQDRQTGVRAYARYQDGVAQALLSRDFDSTAPWLDSREMVTENRVVDAADQLGITKEQARSRYEALGVDLNLKLGWKQ